MTDIPNDDFIEDQEDDLLGADPDEEQPADSPADDDNAPVTRAEARVIAEQQRQILEELRASRQAPAAGEPIQDNPLANNPNDQSAFNVRQQIRLIDTMVSEVRSKNPDCPVQVLEALRNELDKYPTLADLQAIHKKGNHQNWSDAQMMKLMRDGKYVPKNLRGRGVLASDIGSGAVSAAPTKKRQLSQAEQQGEAFEKSVLADLGITFDQNDLDYIATGGTALR